MSTTTLDGTGGSIRAGDTLQGFGLANAGRYATVVEVSRSTARRVLVERHLDGKRFWTFTSYWRLFVHQAGGAS